MSKIWTDEDVGCEMYGGPTDGYDDDDTGYCQSHGYFDGKACLECQEGDERTQVDHERDCAACKEVLHG